MKRIVLLATLLVIPLLAQPAAAVFPPCSRCSPSDPPFFKCSCLSPSGWIHLTCGEWTGTCLPPGALPSTEKNMSISVPGPGSEEIEAPAVQPAAWEEMQQPEDVQPEDVQPEDVQPEDAQQPKDVQPA